MGTRPSGASRNPQRQALMKIGGDGQDDHTGQRGQTGLPKGEAESGPVHPAKDENEEEDREKGADQEPSGMPPHRHLDSVTTSFPSNT